MRVKKVMLSTSKKNLDYIASSTRSLAGAPLPLTQGVSLFDSIHLHTLFHEPMLTLALCKVYNFRLD